MCLIESKSPESFTPTNFADSTTTAEKSVVIHQNGLSTKSDILNLCKLMKNCLDVNVTSWYVGITLV